MSGKTEYTVVFLFKFFGCMIFEKVSVIKSCQIIQIKNLINTVKGLFLNNNNNIDSMVIKYGPFS